MAGVREVGQDVTDVVTRIPTGVRLTVRAKPNQSRARAMRVVDIGDGKRAIEISVHAAAQEGKANKALMERLAEELDIPKKQIDLKSGDTGRLKVLEIQGDPEALLRNLSALLDP